MLGLADGQLDFPQAGGRRDAGEVLAQFFEGVGLELGQMGIHWRGSGLRKPGIIPEKGNQAWWWAGVLSPVRIGVPLPPNWARTSCA
ncbi:protein of unknown function [Denitratisoma oestradiolicum]|uniref:Uncharacterized protein n=1 Tax=Denitratisoma oestradiolicum TaxID=311182 RepID=A0A6S6XWY6_9PROT|nr:protein of unknown function [Denitratisoma oestradiolicum]